MTNNTVTTASKDDILSIEIESSTKLNGSLHMFCQNINKYKNNQVIEFFSNNHITQKLMEGLLYFKPKD
jgi:transposase